MTTENILNQPEEKSPTAEDVANTLANMSPEELINNPQLLSQVATPIAELVANMLLNDPHFLRVMVGRVTQSLDAANRYRRVIESGHYDIVITDGPAPGKIVYALCIDKDWNQKLDTLKTSSLKFFDVTCRSELAFNGELASVPGKVLESLKSWPLLFPGEVYYFHVLSHADREMEKRREEQEAASAVAAAAEAAKQQSSQEAVDIVNEVRDEMAAAEESVDDTPAGQVQEVSPEDQALAEGVVEPSSEVEPETPAEAVGETLDEVKPVAVGDVATPLRGNTAAYLAVDESPFIKHDEPPVENEQEAFGDVADSK